MTLTDRPAPCSTQPGEPVGPIKAIGNFLRKGTTFSGRASRSEYWWIVLYVFLVSSAYTLAKDRGCLGWPDVEGGAGIILAVLALVLMLALVLLNVFLVALSVRRLHDRNISGLWCLLLLLIPPLGTTALLVLGALPSDPRGARFDAQPPPASASSLRG